MVAQPTFGRWLESVVAAGVKQDAVDTAVKQWREQYQGERPAYSTADLPVLAHLANLTMVVHDRQPWIGARQERLTHLVIDEVQDLDPAEVLVLTSMLDPGGTATLMGDLRQNLSTSAGLHHWNDLTDDRDYQRAAVKVNHRQTRQLGGFVQQLHRSLFHQRCMWKASARLTGPKPRLIGGGQWNDLLEAAAREAMHWRQRLNPADGSSTPPLIAVLTVDSLSSQHEKTLVANLRSIGLTGRRMPSRGVTLSLSKDEVVVERAANVKGLEFDAVVFVDAATGWSVPPSEADRQRRNTLFVACSRARGGLSICMSHPPETLLGQRQRRLYRTVPLTSMP